jgi:beta-galactosidase
MDVQETKDTYLNLEKFKRGYVWVNGRNIGRYMKSNPQDRLYCPGVWLKKGKKKILILDLLKADH